MLNLLFLCALLPAAFAASTPLVIPPGTCSVSTDWTGVKDPVKAIPCDPKGTPKAIVIPAGTCSVTFNRLAAPGSQLTANACAKPTKLARRLDVAPAIGSPGVASGNLIQVPIHVPVNACGNTVSIIGLLNPAFANTCVNARRRAVSNAVEKRFSVDLDISVQIVVFTTDVTGLGTGTPMVGYTFG